MKYKILINALAFVLVSTIVAAQSGTVEYKVETEAFLKLRQKPSTTDGIILDTLYKGEVLMGLDSVEQPERNMCWLHCRTKDGKTGYAAIRSGMDTYLTKTEQEHNYLLCSYSMFTVHGIKLPDIRQLMNAKNDNTNEIKYVLKDIESILGIRLNIEILESRDLKDNCVSLRFNNKPYIVYNAKFFTQISNLYRNMEPIYVVLAHEVAHHLKDDLRRGDTSVFEEMEADYYAGKILKSIGLSEKEVDIAIQFLDSYPQGGTHPPLEDRKRKIKQGWQDTPEFESGKAIRTRLERTEYDDISMYKNGFAITKRNGRYGFINQIGREIFSPQFLDAKDFDDEKVAKVKKADGHWYTLTPYGKYQIIN